eukprot:1024507-Pleurochrysis_carterae.AAC.1
MQASVDSLPASRRHTCCEAQAIVHADATVEEAEAHGGAKGRPGAGARGKISLELGFGVCACVQFCLWNRVKVGSDVGGWEQEIERVGALVRVSNGLSLGFRLVLKVGVGVGVEDWINGRSGLGLRTGLRTV